MIYVKRDAQGNIESVSLKADALHAEAASGDDSELAEFVRTLVDDESLVNSDLRLVRVLEDLIELLIDRELIRFTDLPHAAQAKLMQRRSLREAKGGLNLLSSGSELI